MRELLQVGALLLTASILHAQPQQPTRAPKAPQIDLDIDRNAEGKEMPPALRGQNPYRNGKLTPKDFAICQGSLARGPAGGLDADTYDWRDVSSGVWNKGPRYTTLEWLEMVRDHDSIPLITANVIGGGKLSPKGIFDCELGDLQATAALAADWVIYCNQIVPARRARTPEQKRVLKSIQAWDNKPTLPKRSRKPIPKVMYWEVGNEPELDAIPGFISGHRLTPDQYAKRYAVIARAMRAVDPDIKIGPCIIYPAALGGEYIKAVLAHTQPQGEAKDGAQAAAPMDFVSFHPYYHELQRAWGSGPKLEQALLGFDAHIQRHVDAAKRILAEHPAQLIASEWNPMMWNAKPAHYRSMAMALGTLEGIFSFAEHGVWGANFWENAAGKPAVRLVYEKLQELGGDRLLARHSKGSCRLYVLREAKKKRLILWALNFAHEAEQRLHVAVRGLSRLRTMTEHRLSAADAKSGLMAQRGLEWQVHKLRKRPKPREIQLLCPPASAQAWELSW